MQVCCCLLLLTVGTLYPTVATTSIFNLWCCAVTFSTADLGSVGKFWGSHVVPNDGADAVCMCSLLLASCDDKAAWFKQNQEHRLLCKQVAQAGRSIASWVASSLHGALALVATVATLMMAVMAMAITPAAVAVMQEVALLKRGNMTAMCDGDGARVYLADKTWAALWAK